VRRHKELEDDLNGIEKDSNAGFGYAASGRRDRGTAENLKDKEAQKAVEEKLAPAKNRHEMKAKAEPGSSLLRVGGRGVSACGENRTAQRRSKQH